MKHWCRGVVTVAAMVGAFPASAQVERSGNADARVMQQVQQLTGEKTSLQAENAKLKQEIEGLKKELQKSGSERAAAENRAKMLAANAAQDDESNKRAEEQLERSKAQMQELVGRFRETANSLREVETDRATAKAQLASRERELTTCIDRNASFYNLNTEVLDRMENRSFWSAVGEREPFTKLKRVELENLIDDYRYRADELKLEARKQTQAKAE